MLTIIQFVRFAGIGGLALLLNIGITYVLTDMVGFWYLWSYFIATVFSWTFTFFANSIVTFAGHGKNNYAGKYVLFMSMYLATFVVNAGLVYSLTSLVGVHYIFSIVMASVITTAITFFSSKKFIFTYAENAKED